MADGVTCDVRSDPAVGHRVKAIREFSAVSAARIWRDVGIAPRLLELYEAGFFPISAEHLRGLARTLDVPVTRLTGG
jgi:transcriptional regulator with XRE-family HTH domain